MLYIYMGTIITESDGKTYRILYKHKHDAYHEIPTDDTQASPFLAFLLLTSHQRTALLSSLMMHYLTTSSTINTNMFAEMIASLNINATHQVWPLQELVTC